MRKKISSLFFLCLTILALSSCSRKDILLFLNWGEYIDSSIIDAFQAKYNCEVVMDLGDSNKIFYSKVASGTTVYDLVCPSDYTVERMYDKDMLAKIDFTQIPSFDKNNYLEGVKSIADQMEANYKGVSDYYVPYLWGTWGIMYSTKMEGLKQAVTNSGNGWNGLFNHTVLPTGTKVALYESLEHDYFAACKYLGLDNSKVTDDSLKAVYELIDQGNFKAWGTDSIKKDIVAGNLDVGFMWTGDFLYYYCEQAASVAVEALEAGDATIDNLAKVIDDLIGEEAVYKAPNGTEYSIGFECYIPNDTVAFCDNLVIPKDSAHKDLAYKFIDFVVSNSQEIPGEEEPRDPAYDLTYYVCYNTPYLNVYEEVIGLKDNKFTSDDLDLFNSEKSDGTDPYDSTLYWALYDKAIGLSFIKYYSATEVKGQILPNFSRKDIDRIDVAINNARA